jgi:HAD superfamily hydrolase (TIGR01509 family)
MNRPAKAQPTLPAMLFDLDGTLMDSVYHHVMAWGNAFEQSGIHIPLWKIHRRIGMSGKLFAPTLLREIGQTASPARIARLEQAQTRIFGKRLREIRILPGARELLRTLTRMHVSWALATSGNQRQVWKLLEPLHIPTSVPVITGDDVKNAKPAPDIFIVASDRLGVRMSECVVVGDSPWDLLAARRLKALGVGLLCGGYAKEELESAGAHRVYESPRALLDNLADLGINPDA